MSKTPKRRWYQFSLLTLLVVMTLACVGLGWLAYERNEVRKRDRAIWAIEKFGGYVGLDAAQLFRPRWLWPLLGSKSFGEVVKVDLVGTKFTDTDLELLNGFAKLRWLRVSDTEVSEGGVAEWKKRHPDVELFGDMKNNFNPVFGAAADLHKSKAPAPIPPKD